MELSSNYIVKNKGITNSQGVNKPVEKSFGAVNTNNVELPSTQTVGMSQVNYSAPVSYTKIADIDIPGMKEKASLFKLSNGQKVAILPKKGPTFVRTSFSVGSLNEPDNIRGVSHYIEHNLFNGSKDLPPGEYDRKLKELGGYTNAYTSSSETQYHLNLQLLNDKSLEEAIKLNASQTQFPTFPEDQLQREKEPVKQEIDIYEKDAVALADDEMMRNLFGIQSACRNYVIGSKETINSLNRDIVSDYYNTWYTPDNAVTVITGDVDVNETMQLVSKYYNKKPDVSKINNRKYENLKPITQPVRKDIFQSNNPNAILSIGFPVENTNTAQQEQIDLMLSLLNSSTSQLSKRLYDLGVSADFYMQDVSSDKNAPKAISANIQVPEEKTEEVLKVIYEEITNFISNPPSEQLVAQQVRNTIENMKNESEYSEDISARLVKMVKNNDLNYFAEKQNALMQMNSQSVSAFAKTFLDLNRASICVAHPDSTNADNIMANYNNSNVVKNANTVSFGKTINVNQAIEEEKNKTKQCVLNNNICLSTVKTDNSADCSMKMVFEGDYNPNITAGESAVISMLLSRGDLFMGNDNYKKLKEQLNIAISTDFSSNEIVFNGTFDASKTNETISLIKSVLLNPNFTQEEFEKAKQNVKQAFINAQKDPVNKLHQTILPNDKWYLSKEEQIKILDKMTLQDAQRIYFGLLNNSQCGVSVTLPQDDNGFVEQSVINQLSTGMPMARPFVKEKAMQTSLYQPNSQEKIVCDSQEEPQADIIQSYQFKTTNNLEDNVKISMLNYILGGGMSSRLFKDLRENEKIAYSVGSDFYNIRDIGVINMEIGTSTDPNMTAEATPENVNKALNGFNRNVERLKTETISEEELQMVKTVAKTNFLGSLEGNHSKSNLLLGNMNSYYGIDYSKKYLEAIDKITAEDIKAAANYVFANKPITSIVASQYTLDALGLKKNVQ